ncbi:MAG: hypothetical protein KF915_17310 [Polyangiaceae bacterium]|nr:hypothetical protein [Polyangiaceae bacterium]
MRVTWFVLVLVPLSLGCGSSFAREDAGGASGAGGAGASGGAGANGGAGASGGAGGSSAAGGTGGGFSGSGGVGGEVSFSSCERPSDCVVTHRTCCGACGQATAEDRVAVHRDRVDGYREYACRDDLGTCPGCFGDPDPYLVATCVHGESGGQCAVIDLRATDGTSCSTGTDCRVRLNTCCNCGVATDDNVVAVNRGGSEQLDTQLCEDICKELDPCVTVPDFSGYGSACDQGQCIITPVPIPGADRP